MMLLLLLLVDGRQECIALRLRRPQLHADAIVVGLMPMVDVRRQRCDVDRFRGGRFRCRRQTADDDVAVVVVVVGRQSRRQSRRRRCRRRCRRGRWVAHQAAVVAAVGAAAVVAAAVVAGVVDVQNAILDRRSAASRLGALLFQVRQRGACDERLV